MTQRIPPIPYHLARHCVLVDLDAGRELPLQGLDRLAALSDNASDHVLGALNLFGDALAKLRVMQKEIIITILVCNMCIILLSLFHLGQPSLCII